MDWHKRDNILVQRLTNQQTGTRELTYLSSEANQQTGARELTDLSSKANQQTGTREFNRS